MKSMHSVLIGGLMALSLTACSSTGTGGSDMRGSSAAGATASGAGAGGSNNAANTAVPATPPVLDGATPPSNMPSSTANNGVDNGPGSR
jgi:hypothetical protein